jgi:hypothetical protein
MKKMIAKVVPVGDDEVAVQFNQKDLDTLGWKCGDSFKWEETEDGIFLSKECPKEEVSIEAVIDDEAYDCAKFIQNLGRVQEAYFEALFKKCKDMKLYKGISDEDFEDWLFDYCFNGQDSDGEISETFSEYAKFY